MSTSYNLQEQKQKKNTYLYAEKNHHNLLHG